MSAVPPRRVHFVVPASIDDVRRPSGGNIYDQRLAEELGALGWSVSLLHAPGDWPRPSDHDRQGFARLLAALPDASTLLVDGLIGSAAAALAAEADRLRVVVLVHMPLAEAYDDARIVEAERSVLGRAAAVVTTSRWSREWLLDNHALPPERIHVATPGVDHSPVSARSPAGDHLLVVGPVTADKGHDCLVDALSRLQALVWRCTVVGALDLDPGFVEDLRRRIDRSGMADRITFTGPLTSAQLGELRAAVDLAVSTSRRESYGMAIAEALAGGVPAIATRVGGQPEVVARVDGGPVPALLVPPDDPAAVATSLQRWLTDEGVRARLRVAALRRREELRTWHCTARVVDQALRRPGDEPTAPA